MQKEKKITLGEWYGQWFDTRAGGWSPRTKDGYRNLLDRHILPAFGKQPLSALTSRKIKMFYKRLGASGLSSRSIWCVHLLLRRVLDEACREQLICANPAAEVPVPQATEYEPMRLHPRQINRYLEAAKELNCYPIFYIGLAGGLRQGELITPAWAAFDILERRSLLPKRWVNLSEQAAKMLTQEHEQHPEHPYAFLDPKTGQPYTAHRLYYLHRQLLKKTRLPMMGFRDLQSSAKEMEL